MTVKAAATVCSCTRSEMIPHVWRVSLALVRVLLALIFLVVYFISVQSILSIPGLILVAYFAGSATVLALTIASSVPVHRGWFGLASLLSDSFVSLFWVAIYSGLLSPEIWFWVSAASWIFVIAHAEMTQNIWIVSALTGIALTLLFLIPSSSSTNLTGVVLAAGVLAIVWSLQRQQYEKRLSMAARQNVLLRDDAQRARESERQRIAADFHDGPLQAFIGFLMRLELLRKLIAKDNTETAVSELKQLQEIAKKQVNELRSFVRSMRPVEVEGSSFAASLSRLIEQFQKDSGINATFMSSDYDEPAETEISLELLQIVREALNNVQKHSRATRVLVSIAKQVSR
jgi:signal transduction histidine kinase